MVCETILRPRQTISERKADIAKAVARVAAGLASNAVRVKIGPQGAVAFDGITEEERDGISDACMYRRIMATGSALAKARIATAEALSGRSIDRQAVAVGWHSHDSGASWHKGHSS